MIRNEIDPHRGLPVRGPNEGLGGIAPLLAHVGGPSKGVVHLRGPGPINSSPRGPSLTWPSPRCTFACGGPE